MRTKDYSNEIGLQSEQWTMPKPYAAAIIAVILIGGSAALIAARPATKGQAVAKTATPAPVEVASK